MQPASAIISENQDEEKPDILNLCIRGKETLSRMIALQRDIYNLRRQQPTFQGPVADVTRANIAAKLRSSLESFNSDAQQLQAIVEAVGDWIEAQNG